MGRKQRLVLRVRENKGVRWFNDRTIYVCMDSRPKRSTHEIALALSE